MSIIQAYKSDTDGKIFEDKGKYQAHLRKLASARRAEKKVEKMEAEREQFHIKMGQVKSIAELNQFIKDNWKWFWANGAQHEFYRWGTKNKEAAPFHEFHSVFIHELFWQESMSNSHSCPRKGVENFDTRSDYNKGKPTGYPGWRGRINIHVKPPMSKHKKDPYMHDGWGSSYFDRTIINTGSGGGGGQRDKDGVKYISYAYDVTLWAADFPVMYEALRKDQWIQNENNERMHVWRQLGGKGLTQSVTEADMPSDWAPSDPLKGDYSRTKW
jgi:hypothetical protein